MKKYFHLYRTKLAVMIIFYIVFLSLLLTLKFQADTSFSITSVMFVVLMFSLDYYLALAAATIFGFFISLLVPNSWVFTLVFTFVGGALLSLRLLLGNRVSAVLQNIIEGFSGSAAVVLMFIILSHLFPEIPKLFYSISSLHLILFKVAGEGAVVAGILAVVSFVRDKLFSSRTKYGIYST